LRWVRRSDASRARVAVSELSDRRRSVGGRGGEALVAMPVAAALGDLGDSADQIAALLDAARQLDADARADRRHVARHATLAVLIFAGLRIGELLDLRWRDVDLAHSRLRIGRAKTDAGIRHVKT